jgi:fructose-bisphosphate aldolase class II
MPHISCKEILLDARARRYGVGNMLASDIEMATGFCRAAEDMCSPVILCVNNEVNPQIPLEVGIPMIVKAAEACKMPVATILDHGHEFEDIARSIELGLNTVMFDGSLLSFEDNVIKTKQVVDYAHARGVCVEGELGCITGSAVEAYSSSTKAVYTEPEKAVEFIERTGVDQLAISFGNAHGFYKGKPQLDLARVREIKSMVDIPLVMHGASGLEYEEYPRIVEAGISKINYYSALSRKAVSEISVCMSGESKTGYHNFVECAVDSFYSQMKFLMRLFKSVGAAANSMDELASVLLNETLELLNKNS